MPGLALNEGSMGRTISGAIGFGRFVPRFRIE